MSNAFRALKTRNYRLFFGGQILSLIGTWMQIVAQSWLVLKLSGSGLAVGIVTAAQFGPTLLGGVWGGLIADRLPKRRILLVTQSLFAVQGVALGALTASGSIRVWMVYALAFAYGCVQVVDVPTRQAFVSEMVTGSDVMNAIGLNSAVFNAARIVGPAIAGLLIANVDISLCFYANAASFATVLVALWFIRERELFLHDELAPSGRGQIRAGLRYVADEPDLWIPLVLMAVVSTLGLNFQTIMPLLARFTFHGNARTFGTLTSAIALGSLVGAMYSATRHRPSRRLLVGSATLFGAVELVAAFAPSLGAAYIVLPFVGLAAMLFISTCNTSLQLASTPAMRGRVLSLFSLVLLGSTPIGGPLVGWVAEQWSARAAFALGGVTSMAAGLVVGALLLARRRDAVREFEAAPAAEAVVEPVASA